MTSLVPSLESFLQKDGPILAQEILTKSEFENDLENFKDEIEVTESF